jgi:hypothetical protein
MENPFLIFFIFVLILFLYTHITSQWKTSNDLEIYESDYESHAHVQEICSVKQPVVFKMQKEQTAFSFFERFHSSNFEKYDNIDICIKDRQDYNKNIDTKDTAVDYVPLSLRSARRLLTTDTTAKYFSEKNHHFLDESSLDNLFRPIDSLLKPPLSAYTKHDILLGSPLVTTPLRYKLESHQFIAVTRGKIHIKLCPPKYSKIIPYFKDYENYEFWSPLNPWVKHGENREIIQKIKFLDVDLHTGDVLFVPPYWWHSISFSGDPETTVAIFTYDVAMNILAQSKHWGLYFLQQNNIKTRPAKVILSEDGERPSPPPEKENEKEDILEPDSKTPVKREIVTNSGIYIT